MASHARSPFNSHVLSVSAFDGLPDRIKLMLTRFRLFLACLVMVALPLQGLAAASMLFCGMGTSHSMQVQAPDGHDHATHVHGDAGGDVHTGMHHAQEPSSKTGSLPDAGHKCGVCAACCHGAAISSLTAAPVALPLPQADLAEPFVLIHARASAVPDKPPRLARV